MPVTDRNIPAGTTLVAEYKGKTYECTFDGDAFNYDGTAYTSLSKAGSVVAGGTSVNGWRFWTPVGDFVAKEPRAPKPANGARAGSIAERTKTVKFIRPMKKQDGVAEGHVRYWCSSCMDAFTVAKGEPHDTCPKGHADRYVDDMSGVAIPAGGDDD